MPLRGFTLEAEALAVFNRAASRERVALLEVFDFLKQHPEEGFDSVVTDDVGRRLRVLHRGRFAIFWWEDLADRRLRVVALEELR